MQRDGSPVAGHARRSLDEQCFHVLKLLLGDFTHRGSSRTPPCPAGALPRDPIVTVGGCRQPFPSAQAPDRAERPNKGTTRWFRPSPSSCPQSRQGLQPAAPQPVGAPELHG